jgi:hypothetical protein
MKFTLDGNGYQWDYQSAMRGPEAPEGTPASFSDMGSGHCHRGGDDGRDH